MTTPVVYNATSARQNFFELLKAVEEGKEAIIVKKDRDVRFKVSLVPKAKKYSKVRIAKEMSKIGLPTGPWKEMEKIISTLHDVKV